MDKKATNKDVAKMANVSVATVSYVMNNKLDKRIPEATRKKVIQIANFLNYTPNPYAVNLSTNQAHNIIVRSSPKSNFWQDAETMLFLNEFNQTLQDKEFSLAYSPNKRFEKLVASACICLNFSNEEFYMLSNENFIPLILIDSELNDPVFYQINTNYVTLKAKADDLFGSNYVYCAIDTNSVQLKDEIKSIFSNVMFVTDIKDIAKVQNATKNIVVSQKSLFDAFPNMDNSNILKYDSHLEKRYDVIYNCIEQARNRIIASSEEHFIKL